MYPTLREHKEYVVMPGETARSLALKFYGNVAYARIIEQHNQAVVEGVRIILP